jgi:hypothetical protein
MNQVHRGSIGCEFHDCPSLKGDWRDGRQALKSG